MRKLIVMFAMVLSTAFYVCCNNSVTKSNDVDSVTVDTTVVDSVIVDSISTDSVTIDTINK